MKDGDEYEDKDGEQEGEDAAKFVRDGAQDGIGEEEVSFWLNVRGCYKRISGGEVVWVSEEIGGEEG